MGRLNVETLLIAADTTIKHAMQRLNEIIGGILFVADNDRVLWGTLSSGDIRRGIIAGYKFDDKVEQIMRKEFYSVKTNHPDLLKQVKALMLEHGIDQIPVVDDRGIIKDVYFWLDIFGENKKTIPTSCFDNSVVIMAGGKGERLDPFTKILPKPLIPIGNTPIIELIMNKFYSYGFSKFIYTLNYKKEYLKLFLRENNFPYTIEWVEEEKFLGTAGSLSLLKNKLEDSFFVTNCDSIVNINLQEVLNWHKDSKASMTIIGCHNEVKIPFGVLQIDNEKLINILEKPVHDIIINTGVYIMEPAILDYIPEGKQMDINNLIDIIKEKEKISVFHIYGGWFDIGQWDEYKKTVQKLEISTDV